MDIEFICKLLTILSPSVKQTKKCKVLKPDFLGILGKFKVNSPESSYFIRAKMIPIHNNLYNRS